MTNPCASRSVAVQDVHVKVTNWERCIVYNGSSRLQRFHAGPPDDRFCRPYCDLSTRLNASLSKLVLDRFKN